MHMRDCNWSQYHPDKKCQWEATLVFESGLAYCPEHYQKVLQLREWLWKWSREIYEGKRKKRGPSGYYSYMSQRGKRPNKDDHLCVPERVQRKSMDLQSKDPI